MNSGAKQWQQLVRIKLLIAFIKNTNPVQESKSMSFARSQDGTSAYYSRQYFIQY